MDTIKNNHNYKIQIIYIYIYFFKDIQILHGINLHFFLNHIFLKYVMVISTHARTHITHTNITFRI